jgi:predicted GNAT family acetyltransferase
MLSWRIEHFPKIVNTPAVPFLVHAWDDLLRNRLCDPHTIWMQWDDGAVLAFSDGEPVGAISYAVSEWDAAVYVRIGYVPPELRGQGIYRTLWGHLVTISRNCGAKVIRSATNIGNRPMRAVAEKLNRTEEQVTLIYRLHP